jgi:hypothetical protein
MIELDKINFDNNKSLSKYKIIKWTASHKVKGINFEEKLLDYLENGGN